MIDSAEPGVLARDRDKEPGTGSNLKLKCIWASHDYPLHTSVEMLVSVYVLNLLIVSPALSKACTTDEDCTATASMSTCTN